MFLINVGSINYYTVNNLTKHRRDFFQRESYQRVFNESRSFTTVPSTIVQEKNEFFPASTGIFPTFGGKYLFFPAI